jgi:alanine racemase
MSSLAPESKSLAVIKADAYGHGAVQVAQALSDCVDLFAVAFVDEAKHLRENAINAPLLVFQGAFTEQECSWAADNQVWLVVHTEQQFEWIDGLNTTKPVIWPKIDTGMHRLGFSPERFRSLIDRYRHLLSERSVIFTHLACSDEPENSKSLQQLARLKSHTDGLKLDYSIANSAGVIHWQAARAKWNRLGIGLYGGLAGPNSQKLQLQAVMSLHADVIALREIEPGETVGYGSTWVAEKPTRLATVAIGYADGYPRHAPNGTPAWCKGQRIFLVGRVSMDMLVFDVTENPNVNLGDSVELWGQNLLASEVAEHVNTIDYELLTRVSQRVPRRYE